MGILEYVGQWQEEHDREEAESLGITVEELYAGREAGAEVRRAKWEVEEAKRRAEADRRTAIRKEEEEFLGRQYNVKAATVAYSISRSGLSVRSSGSGATARTVNHLLLTEPFGDSRIKREAGEYLCGDGGTSWGMIDLGPSRYGVTCPRCREIAHHIHVREMRRRTREDGFRCTGFFLTCNRDKCQEDEEALEERENARIITEERAAG